MTQPGDSSDTASQALTIADVLDTLTGGEIQEEHGILPWGSNYAYLVSISDDRRTVLAVYKPQRGERPLWDFPQGTLCYREVAAFIVSEALDWQIVPPTVLRAGPYGLGSVQFFIDHDPEITYFTPFPAACEPQLQQIAVFDFLINNADRKGGHCLLDSQSHLWGIDHGISFHQAPKLRTVIWEYAGLPLPDAIVADLQALQEQVFDRESALRVTLRQLLLAREVAAFGHRLETILALGTFVEPGPGQNYPWPPV